MSQDSAQPGSEGLQDRNKRLRTYFSRYKGWFLAGAFFLVVTNVLGLAIPQYLGGAVQLMRDAGEVGSVREDLTRMALIIIALAIGAGIARIFSRIYIFNAGRLIEFDIRNELYEKLAGLSPRFFASMTTGDLTSRVTNDVTYVRLLFAISFLHIINTALAFGIALQKMFSISVFLTLCCLAPYPLLLLIVRKIIHALFRQTKVVQAMLSDLSSEIQENLTGIQVIKAYVLEEREKGVFGELNQSFLKENMRLVTIRGSLQAVMTLIAGVGTLVVLLVGARMVLAEELTLGQFVEFNAYVVALAFPTMALGWVFSVWHRGLAGFDRILTIFRHEDALKLDPIGKRLPSRQPGTDRGEIRFENVDFQYDEDEDALKGLSLTIPAGGRVAIVGKTGAGKSTVLKLIARLYDPQQGQILVDGVPLKELDIRQYRSELGVVGQEPFLFSMSIRGNIRFGVDGLEDPTIVRPAPLNSLLDGVTKEASQADRVEQAVQIAGLALDVEGFPQGLDTPVGERGITLSGGQKQRVTIARALMMDPRILILDDALSSIDTKTERAILDHLQEVMKGRTTIMVTHRFNALKDFDKIFVLHEGRLVQSGTHDELIKAGGLYAQMHERQQLQSDLE